MTPYQGSFTKYDHMVMNTIWKLSPEETCILDSCELGVYRIGEFLSKIQCNYNISYQDRIEIQDNTFQVHYNFTSRHHLEWMLKERSDTMILYQLRINRANKYYGCLVRPLP